jgi:PAS domain S-box-containing protein
MVQLSDVEGSEAGLSSAFMRGVDRAVQAGARDGAAVVFDHELRVRFAVGMAFAGAGAGAGPMVGRLLPDLMRAESWQVLKEPYEAAVTGRTTRFALEADGLLFSIHVSPIVLQGGSAGGLAVSHALPDQQRTETSIVGSHSADEVFEQQLLHSGFDRAPAGISAVDLDGRWLRINDAYCRMLGYERAELLGTSFCDRTHPDDVDSDREFVAAAIAGGPESFEREKRYVHKDGSAIWARVRVRLIRNESGEPLYFVSHLQDISEQRAAQGLLHDSERTLRSVIDNTPAIICVKGRDHRYQLVNRGFEEWCGVPSDLIVGHTVNEMSWGPVAEEERARNRAKDQSVLDGGGTMEEEETVVRGAQERAFLTTRFPLFDEHGRIHAVCASSTDITERRLEEGAKRERLQCSELIYSALAQDRFVLHGQPIVDLASMQPAKIELLIRMRKVRRSEDLAAPGEFLPAAERFDLIQVIDEWVVDRAIELATAGHCVTVNVSAKTISDPRQVDRIERAVVASGASPQDLVFEITETAVADNLDAARTFAVRLHGLGCGVALDDFGVGHGSFTYLRHVPVDYLKIDMQFVRELLSDDEDRQVVEAIVGIARQFKIKTIAEGVEDQATLDELRGIGVDYAQGYWTGRPVPLAQLGKSPNRRRSDPDTSRARKSSQRNRGRG